MTERIKVKQDGAVLEIVFARPDKDGKLAEHWDVLQEEATKAQSLSGLPMFGDRFPG